MFKSGGRNHINHLYDRFGTVNAIISLSSSTPYLSGEYWCRTPEVAQSSIKSLVVMNKEMNHHFWTTSQRLTTDSLLFPRVMWYVMSTFRSPTAFEKRPEALGQYL